MRESQAIEQARCALGADLATYRRAAGYSQAELARLTTYSRSTVANVETGRQHAPLGFWQRADTAVGAGGALTAANDKVEAAVRREREAAARAARAARLARAEQWRPPDTGDQEQRRAGAGWTETIGKAHVAAVSLWSGGLDDPALGDEDAGSEATVVALRWLIAPPGASAARLDGWRPICSGDLRRLRGVRQCLKDIDNAHGGGAALPMAMSYVRGEIPRLLDGRYDDATGRGLFEVVAELQHDVVDGLRRWSAGAGGVVFRACASFCSCGREPAARRADPGGDEPSGHLPRAHCAGGRSGPGRAGRDRAAGDTARGGDARGDGGVRACGGR